MSMYKTIFVTEAEDQNAAGGKILSVNGEISLTGESAFASLNEAVAAVQKATSNAIVIKVASGKYEEFVVINEGVALNDVTVVAVDFNGGNVVVEGKEVSIEKSGLAADAQATILAELNDNNAAEGKIFVAADVAPAGAPTLYVGVDAENNYVVGTPSSSIIVSDSNNISSSIENLISNPAQPITGTTTTPDLSTGNDAPENNAAGTDTPASTPSDSTSINTADKLNITEDTTLAGTNTVDGTHLVVNNGATLTVEKEATLNNKGFMFAGDDESWSGFGDSQKGGTINIKGEVNTNQTNANADGKITVEGTLNSPIVNVDNGGMSDREAGEVSVVKGGVINAAQMNVMHADSVLNIEGEGSSVNIANTKGSGTSVFFKNSGTTTIKNGGSLVFDMTDGDKVDVSGDKTGLVNDGTLTVENASLTVKSDKGLINNGVFAANNSTITVGTLANSGEFNIAGSKFTADAVSGAGSFIINDNATATELQIGSSSAKIEAKGDATVTGDIKNTTGYFFAYDTVTVSGLKINSDYTGENVKASGYFITKGNVTIADNSEITVGGVQFQNSGVLESGSVIKANTVNVYDFTAEDGDAVFKVQGRLEAVSFIVLNDYYYPGNDNFIIDKGGVLRGETQDWGGSHGRFDIQSGNMTVYGYVDANWTSGGGDASVGNSGLNASLTVDGTYAEAGENDGKFINVGNQALFIGGTGVVNVINGAEFSWNSTVTNEGYFKVGQNATVTVGSLVMDGNGMLDVWGQEGKNATFNASSITAKGADSSLNSYRGDINVDGTIEAQGNFSIYGSTLKADTFKNVSAGYQREFNDVDLDVTNFVNNVKDGGKYATIGGTSKVQIDNLSGDRLHFADGTVLKGGTSIKGTTSTRSLGDITFGETKDDMIHIDSFSNNGTSAYDGTITVNGTLSISGNGDDKNSPTYWLGIHGSKSGTLLTSETGKGVINSSGLWNIFQYGKITVDEGVTINIADAYARDLRFTLTDITIKGEINSIGNNNKLNAIKTSTVTLTGENAALNLDGNLLVGYDYYYVGGSDTTNAYKSTLTVSDGATLSVGGRFIINKDSVVMVDSDSTFSVGTIENNGGSINSTTAGEVVIDRTMNVAGIVKTDTLVLKQGAALSAGSITVDNLTLSIGSTLALSGKSSTVESITVVGDIVPSNSEFTLITSGWDTILTATAGKPAISYKGNTYTVVDYDDSLKGLQFFVVGSSLYVKDFGANVTGIYIGELVEGLKDGDKITDETGATYTVGKDAFASIDEALASDALKEDGAKDKVTSVIIDSDIDSDDKLSNVAEQFQNLKEVEWQIEAGADVSDTASFNGNLNLNNDGHLDANITISGDFTFTNTAKDTLVGEYAAYSITGINTGAMAGGYTADDKIVIDNTSGIIGADKGEAYFGGSQVEITGGDASNVTVNAGSLTLTDTTTFGLNADSTILAGKDNIWIPSDQTGKLGNIMVVGSANLSIDGDNSAIGANIENVDHTGTVTFNGNQTYTGDLAANKFVVAAGKNVTVNSNQFDFNELAIAGTLSTDFTSQDSFTKAGSITGTGSFITTHGGAWIINDSVERNFTGFTGSVFMAQTGASIVMGKGDAIAESTIDSSYFADGTTVTIDGTQSVVLAGNGKNTKINFKGAGTINVGAYNIVPDYKDVFADQSEDFSQTLSGVNGEFTGTVNVSEGAVLKLESAIGATKIDLDYEATQSATDVADKHDTQLILNVEDAAKDAVIYGDANDIIVANKDQLLEKDSALNNFEGKVELNANDLTLNGTNTTAATITGTADSVINANADQTLSGNNKDFKGDINVAEGKSLTLQGNMGAANINLDAPSTAATGDVDATKLNLDAADLTLNAEITGDENDQINVLQSATLEKDGALNKFNGDVNVNANTITLNGSNTTAAEFTGTGVIDANKEQTLTGTGALNNFHGEVALEGNTLNLNGENTTDAKFTGTADSVINANADQTLSGNNSDFKGDVNVKEGETLTLQGAMGAATIDLGHTEVPNKTTLVLDKDGLALNAEITGDSDDVIDVEQNASLEKDGALDKFSGIVDTNTGSTISLNGSNVTDAVFNGSGVVDVNAEQTLNGKDALTNFHGEVALDGNTVNLNNTNNTDAEFTSNANAGVINANADQTLSGDNSGFTGDLNIAEGATVTLKNAMGAATIDLGNGTDTTAATLTLEKDALVLNSVISGDKADVINVKESVTLTADNSGFKGEVNIDGDKALTIQNNLGANTVNFGVSSDLNVTKDAVIDSKFVSTTGDTAANVTISAGISATLSALNALNGFTGTVNVVKTDDATSKLILSDANNTSATITGSGIIDADADQIFSGNVSGFGGIYDIETSVTLSGTIADEITAKGNTLNLTNATGKDIVINSTADGNLTNLNFGANNITLGIGDTDDFENISGSGNILDIGNDQKFGAIDLDLDNDASTKAGTIFIDSADEIIADSVDANINITINDYQNITDKADITFGGVYDETISVNVDYKTTYLQGGYRLVTSDDFTEDDSIVLTVTNYDDNVDGEKSVNTIKVDQRVVIEGKTYLLQLKENTLILTELPGYSNYVAIDGSWSGRVPYQSVDDEGKERIVGYDAASKLNDAVGYIKGYDKGINANAGTNMGDATMELMSGAYQLTTGTLMTYDTQDADGKLVEGNGVTQLILKGRDGNEVIISGTLRGSDGSKETSLVIENIRTTGYVFGGGDLTIKNSASIRTSGNAIAAGIANQDANNAQTMMFDTNLTINGGYFTTSVLTGGSVAFGGNVNVIGDTSVVINNTTDETLTITGNIFGGSYAAQGTVTQTSDAYVLVNATKATTLRGNIYVSGFQSSKGTLNMSGNSYITFTGAAENLNFTGTVSAIQSDKAEIATFKSFKGQFNGSLIGFDSITISGDTNLSLGRRQTETANTGLTFTVNSQTQAMADGQTNVKAMYTVRDSNAWEFSKQIVIDTRGSGAAAGTSYLIVDNYAGGFDGFTFTINGQNYTSLEAANAAGLTYNATTGQLIYKMTEAASRVDLDVDAVLNGDFSAATGKLNVTGIKDLHTDNFGVKAIVASDTASVDSVLANATIDGIESGEKIYQLTGADTTTVSTDDVWAGLGVDASGDVLVVWGDNKQFVENTIAEFGTYDLNLGDTYTVSNPLTSPEDNSLFKDEYKKNGSNGTLA